MLAIEWYLPDKSLMEHVGMLQDSECSILSYI